MFPDGKVTSEECGEILSFAIEGRRRVREHILRIDDTFVAHEFIFKSNATGDRFTVLTPEEIQYPTFAPAKKQSSSIDSKGIELESSSTSLPQLFPPAGEDGAQRPPTSTPDSGPMHVVVTENTKRWSYRRLFAEHLKGARNITSDPYIRAFFQVRNLMEFLEMVHQLVPEGDEVSVDLVTQADRENPVKQEDLNQVKAAFGGSPVSFSWKFDSNPNFHACSIVTDTGWKITIDRGLDIFQKFETGVFSLEQALQEARLTRGAEVTYLRV